MGKEKADILVSMESRPMARLIKPQSTKRWSTGSWAQLEDKTIYEFVVLSLGRR